MMKLWATESLTLTVDHNQRDQSPNALVALWYVTVS